MVSESNLVIAQLSRLAEVVNQHERMLASDHVNN